MVAAIKKIVYISNTEDYNGKILIFQAAVVSAVFLLSVFNWQTAVIGHLLLMLYISVSSCQIAQSQKQISSCFLKLTRFNNLQKLWVYCASAFLQNRIVIIAFMVHILIFHGFSVASFAVILTHTLFSLSFGLGISALLKNYHANFIVIFIYYSFMIFKSLSFLIQELESGHYFSPFIQLLNMERIHWASQYGMLSLGLFFMAVFIIKIDDMPKQSVIAVIVASALVFCPVVYEQRGYDFQNIKFENLRIQNKDIEYDSNLNQNDVAYLANIVLGIQESMVKHGIKPADGFIKFRKNIITFQNYPSLVFWNGEGFTFQVFSNLFFSDNPDLKYRIMQTYTAYLTSRSGAATNNQMAYSMKDVMDRVIVSDVMQAMGDPPKENRIKINQKDFFAGFALFMIKNYPCEIFWEIYQNINVPYIKEDAAISKLQYSYSEYYYDYLSNGAEHVL